MTTESESKENNYENELTKERKNSRPPSYVPDQLLNPSPRPEEEIDERN
jgi:hypothetical protein